MVREAPHNRDLNSTCVLLSCGLWEPTSQPASWWFMGQAATPSLFFGKCGCVSHSEAIRYLGATLLFLGINDLRHALESLHHVVYWSHGNSIPNTYFMERKKSSYCSLPRVSSSALQRARRNGSLGKILVTKAWESEFRSQHPSMGYGFEKWFQWLKPVEFWIGFFC